MKGDFSKWGFSPSDNYTGVLHQQGRVLLDADWNAGDRIEAHWRENLGRDAIGGLALAVPASEFQSFKAVEAKVSGGEVFVTLKPGRGWADGTHLYSPSPATSLPATYLPAPINPAGTSAASIGQGVRDALVLEVWEDAVSAFQEPRDLLEPALGGVDTTERARACMALRLLRLTPDEDCDAVAARAQDDPSKKGRLTVTPQPALVIAGDCPLETGGGYTGLEHHLYRIETGEPKAGQARFKWSQFNGGLVGTGRQVTLNKVRVEANNQAINHCGLTEFYLEALTKDALGCWRAVFAAAAVLSQDDELTLTPDFGTWPGGPADRVFFRLWNGIAPVSDFPAGPGDPKELKHGIRLAFDAPAADLSNYRPGDYWSFPVRAAGAALDTSLWPSNAPPQGINLRRVPLAVLEWQADGTASYDKGQIDDCRRVFRPITRQGVCCTYVVGDGRTTHGDFDSIQEAVDALPKAGGQVCLLPGVHEAAVSISKRFNVTIRGCGIRTKVVPVDERPDDPLFSITDSQEVVLEQMDLASLGGTAVQVMGSEEGAARRIELRDNRILACDVGIRVENGRFVGIHRNRIRMVDKPNAGVAIFLQADDSLVERNEITVVPAPQMPPLDQPGGGDEIQPTDPCARLAKIYRRKKLVAGYLNRVWTVILALPSAPYRALSGIQVAAGAERVTLRENSITGGAGNGVSLGGVFTVPETEPGETRQFFVDIAAEAAAGQVAVPEGKSPKGIQLGFTNTATGQQLQAVTDDKGGFVVKGPAGHYEVKVISSGYAIDKLDRATLGSMFFYVLTLREVETRPDPTAAFLYDIRIEGNEIAGMGLCGIGLAPQPAARAAAVAGIATHANVAASPVQTFLALFGNPVTGLLITRNRISGCLQNPFDATQLALAARRGLGGISLGMCEDVSILDNLVEKNGASHLNPVCGIYVAFGEEITLNGNRVAENGPFTAAPANSQMQAGVRGGIVVTIASATSLVGAFTGGAAAITSSQRPAARVHGNVVDQPAGQALTLGAFGPVACTDNSFSSELSGVRPFDRLAGSVLIFNLGGVQNTGGGTKIAAKSAEAVNIDAAPEAGAAPAANTLNVKRRVYTNFNRAQAAYRVMPGGYTQFNDNQVRTGGLNTSFACQAILSMDDVAYQANQCYSYRTGNLIANAIVFASTLRASGNRLSEAGPETLMSLYTLAMKMNNTTFNQGDHCIIATDQNPAMPEIQTGNQVLFPGALCRSLNMVSDLMFKAQG